jgi:hypothetical protein
MGNRVAGLPEGTFSGWIDFQNAFALLLQWCLFTWQGRHDLIVLLPAK